MSNNKATPKDILIADIIVSVVLILVMVLCLFVYGSDLKVVENVSVVPENYQKVLTGGKVNSKPGSGSRSETYMVFLTDDERMPEKFQVQAKPIYGTTNEKKLEKIADKKEEISINIFIENRFGRIIGATREGTSIFAFNYYNSFVFKFCLFALVGINVFFIILMLVLGKKKKTTDVTFKVVDYTGNVTLENNFKGIVNNPNWDMILDYINQMLGNDQDFVTLTLADCPYDIRYMQACKVKSGISVQLGIEKDNTPKLVEKICDKNQTIKYFETFNRYGYVADADSFNPVEFVV